MQLTKKTSRLKASNTIHRKSKDRNCSTRLKLDFVNLNGRLVHIYLPDIAGVRIPSPMTMEVPIKTNSNRRVFKDDLLSKVSFILKALSNSGVGSLSLKLDICSSAGWRFGSMLTFAYLQISEYNAKVPPTIASIYMLTCKWSSKYPVKIRRIRGLLWKALTLPIIIGFKHYKHVFYQGE